ncbi:hypothetical protein [Ornithinimicrobium panacihumi]|uniref:hypothetical protein n=1 Tax=Ornithinimicrobium panacihumi TaxID=2008449 RepID=UPI003F88F0F3
MTLSPRGSSAIPNGNRNKALLMMLMSGPLAWVSGLWFASETPMTEGIAPRVISIVALAVLTVPAQLIGGRASHPWMMALAGTFGLALPWWLNLALNNPGEGGLVLARMIVLILVALAAAYAAAWLTRYSSRRWADA